MIAVWRKADLTEVPLAMMSHDHIINVINCINRGAIHPNRVVQGMKTWQWKLIFQAELRRRGK